MVVTMMVLMEGDDDDGDGGRAVAETATGILSSPSRRAFNRKSWLGSRECCITVTIVIIQQTIVS
jgi:hypothetical protein